MTWANQIDVQNSDTGQINIKDFFKQKQKIHKTASNFGNFQINQTYFGLRIFWRSGMSELVVSEVNEKKN